VGSAITYGDNISNSESNLTIATGVPSISIIVPCEFRTMTWSVGKDIISVVDPAGLRDCFGVIVILAANKSGNSS